MLDELNRQQALAASYVDGPLLILAGAGSGKTKVLTTRVAYLIREKGIMPSNILAITFTNKAAKEMKDRIFKMLGKVSYDVQISTFHAFGVLIVRENYDRLGYSKNFTILDSDDSLTIIKKIIKDMNLDPKDYSPRAIRNKISGAKNELMTSLEYERYVNNKYDEVVLEIFKRYEKKVKSNNSLDFDDLLLEPIRLFKKNKDVLKEYQERYKYILVDEYQDTNEAQYQIIKLLGKRYKNVCVVGDVDQSIYGFRGANYRNILNFEKDYPDAEVIKLEENYRSTGNILKAANDVIKHNKERKEKRLWTSKEDGAKIRYHRSYNEKEESLFIANEIEKLVGTGAGREDIAVLYRTNAQSRAIEEMLLQRNIPYKVVGSFYFYNRKEIKDLIAYLKLIYNPDDDVSLMRVINEPKRSIGSKTVEGLAIKAASEGVSLYRAIDGGKELEFKKIIESLIKDSQEVSLTELVDLVLDKSGMKKTLEKDKSIESEVRLENLEEFKSITKDFEERSGLISLEDFLLEVSLVSDMEEHKNRTDVVTLMTVHGAKGLEFDYVFLAGLEEGIFPNRNCLDSDSEVEEERRLCYVAITRARKGLYLVNAKRRLLYGDIQFNKPSRFIAELNSDYLEIDDDVEEKVNKEDMIDDSILYSVGDKVVHDKYGEGIVVGTGSILTIAFSAKYGIIKIMKGHKSLRKV